MQVFLSICISIALQSNYVDLLHHQRGLYEKYLSEKLAVKSVFREIWPKTRRGPEKPGSIGLKCGPASAGRAGSHFRLIGPHRTFFKPILLTPQQFPSKKASSESGAAILPFDNYIQMLNRPR